jgi:threonine synthase
MIRRATFQKGHQRMQNWRYVCEVCGTAEPIDTRLWRCPVDGGAFALDGPNEIAPELIDQNEPTLWRYEALLPAPRPESYSLGEGLTPLVRGQLGGRDVWFKNDALLPTGSFKDRGAAVLVSHLNRLGLTRLIVDSSGNAAAAMAGFCAAAGIECTVYAPANASPGKLVQARAYGATVHAIEGNRDAVAGAAQQAAEDDISSFYASHNWHAVFVEGVKTWALEVWEQLGGALPSAVFVPTGGGSAFVGAHRGFQAIPGPLPMLVAAQPDACAPIVAAAHQDANDIAAVTPGNTIAEGTKIGSPSRGRQILAALRESGGWAAAVTEEDIREALVELWSQGMYAEPTAAVGAAAFRNAVRDGHDLPDGDIVVLITGNGLKATETIADLIG